MASHGPLPIPPSKQGQRVILTAGGRTTLRDHLGVPEQSGLDPRVTRPAEH
ncbi:hypothetical protein [Nocardia sp. CA-290969]|uniref:hypothetical protein n=1 Tax=Nocardia sp. CA-290969 TaxID=3239986 RepID=UPI003D89C6C7